MNKKLKFLLRDVKDRIDFLEKLGVCNGKEYEYYVELFNKVTQKTNKDVKDMGLFKKNKTKNLWNSEAIDLWRDQKIVNGVESSVGKWGEEDLLKARNSVVEEGIRYSENAETRSMLQSTENLLNKPVSVIKEAVEKEEAMEGGKEGYMSDDEIEQVREDFPYTENVRVDLQEAEEKEEIRDFVKERESNFSGIGELFRKNLLKLGELDKEIEELKKQREEKKLCMTQISDSIDKVKFSNEILDISRKINKIIVEQNNILSYLDFLNKGKGQFEYTPLSEKTKEQLIEDMKKLELRIDDLKTENYALRARLEKLEGVYKKQQKRIMFMHELNKMQGRLMEKALREKEELRGALDIEREQKQRLITKERFKKDGVWTGERNGRIPGSFPEDREKEQEKNDQIYRMELRIDGLGKQNQGLKSVYKTHVEALQNIEEFVKWGLSTPDLKRKKTVEETKMKRFAGIIPSKLVKLEKLFDNGDGDKATIQAADEGWLILYHADHSFEYKNVKSTAEDNFEEALDVFKLKNPKSFEI